MAELVTWGKILEHPDIGLGMEIAEKSRSQFDSLNTIRADLIGILSGPCHDFGYLARAHVKVRQIGSFNLGRFYRGKTIDLVWFDDSWKIYLACQIDGGISKQSIQKLASILCPLKILVSCGDLRASLQRIYLEKYTSSLERHSIHHWAPFWLKEKEKKAQENIIQSKKRKNDDVYI